MKTLVKSRKVAAPKRLTKAARLGELRAFVDLCFASLEEPADYKELGNATGLSAKTVYRLATGQFSLAVRYGTIQALGYAAGMRLVEEEFTYRVVLVD